MKRALAGFLLVAVASIAFTWPASRHFGRTVPTTPGSFDPPLQSFILGWDWQALARDYSSPFDAPIFYPEPRTLTYMDHLIGEMVVASPMLMWSVAGGYNLLMLMASLLSAWAVYRLCRSLQLSRSGSFLAAWLYTFSQYRLANIALLNQFQTQFLPLAIYFAYRLVQRGKVRHLAGLTGIVVLQVYFGLYYAWYLVIAVALLAGYKFAQGWRPHRPKWFAAAGLFACALLVIMPVTLPYIATRFASGAFGRTLGETVLYSADVLDYFRWNTPSLPVSLLRLPHGAQSYWPGFATVGLGVWAIAYVSRGARRRMQTSTSAAPLQSSIQGQVSGFGYFIALGLVSVILSLGPVLKIAGLRTWIILPYAVLFKIIPGFASMRAPARFALVFQLAFAVLAGLGFDLVSRIKTSNRLPALSNERHPLATRPTMLLVIALGVATFEAWHTQPVIELPSRYTIPQVYAWLQHHEGDKPILELPAPPSNNETEVDALRQFYVLFHGHPRLDGCSGYVSPQYLAFRRALQAFPDSSSLDSAYQFGARLLVVHFNDYPKERRHLLQEVIAAEQRLKSVATFDDECIYELGPTSGEVQSAQAVPTERPLPGD